VVKTGKRRGYKRGYPVAVLVGFAENHVMLWQIFSNVAKPGLRLALNGSRKDQKALYSYHETIVDALRPMLSEGVRSIILASPPRTSHAQAFLNHIQKHHAYMTQPNSPNPVTFATIVASATQSHEIAELTKTKEFRTLIGETTSTEADQVVTTLEKRLNETDNNAITLFSLSEIEELVYSREEPSAIRPEYVVMTDRYLAECKERSRVQRLLQISQNKKIRTRVVSVETPAGKRLSQLGGLVCFGKPQKEIQR